MPKIFWTKERREYLAKRLGEFAMVSFVAAYASDFFAKFLLPVRITIIVTVIIVIVTGILLTKGE